MSQTFLEDIPEFLEIQRNSFLRILDTGLIGALEKINPISTTSGCEVGLLFYPKDYVLVLPENTITECFLQGKTYGCKIYVPAVVYETQKENYSLSDLKNKSLTKGKLSYQKKDLLSLKNKKAIKTVSLFSTINGGLKTQTKTLTNSLDPKISTELESLQKTFKNNLLTNNVENLKKRSNKCLIAKKLNLRKNLTYSKSIIENLSFFKLHLGSLLQQKVKNTSSLLILQKAQKSGKNAGSAVGAPRPLVLHPLASEPRAFKQSFDNESIGPCSPHIGDAPSKAPKVQTLDLYHKKTLPKFANCDVIVHHKYLKKYLGPTFESNLCVGLWTGRSTTRALKEKIARPLNLLKGDKTKTQNWPILQIVPKSLPTLMDPPTSPFWHKINPIDHTYNKQNMLEIGFLKKLNPKLKFLEKNNVLKSNSTDCVFKSRQLSKKEWVCIGVLPLMTPRGHFIINGSHRIVVSQMSRAPGLYYQQGEKLQATIVPSKGAWLRISLKMAENGEIKIWVRITPQRKMPYKIFIETYKHLESSKGADLSQSKFLNLTYQSINSKIKHFDKHYAIGVISGQINRTLLNLSSYTLGSLGRKRINDRLGINEKKGYITSKDISFIKNNLIKFLDQNSTELHDDIDHLQNRRVKTCGELLQVEIEVGMGRLKKAITKQLDECLNPNSFTSLKFSSNLQESSIKRNTAPFQKKDVSNQGFLNYSPWPAIARISETSDVRDQIQDDASPLPSCSAPKLQGCSGLAPLALTPTALDLSPFCSAPGSGPIDPKSPTQVQEGALHKAHKVQEVIRKVQIQPQESARPRLTVFRRLSTTSAPSCTLWTLLWTLSRSKTEGARSKAGGFGPIGPEPGALQGQGDLTPFRLKYKQKNNVFLPKQLKSFFIPKILKKIKNAQRSGLFQSQIYWPPRVGVNLALKDTIVRNKQYFDFFQRNLSANLSKSFGMSSSQRQNIITLESVFGPMVHKAPVVQCSTPSSTRAPSYGPIGLKPPTLDLAPSVLDLDKVHNKVHKVKEGARPTGPKLTCTQLCPPGGKIYRSKVSGASSGPKVQQQLQEGEIRVQTPVSEKQFNLIWSPSKIVGTKAFAGALREFFGSNPLSQYMDQTNPLAEITHKRRLSSLGPGGVDRASAGIAIRGIHPSHYGRICPIETPEGKNAGLVNSMTMWTRVNKDGFLETPYLKVKGGSIMSHKKNLAPQWNFNPTKNESQKKHNLKTILNKTTNHGTLTLSFGSKSYLPEIQEFNGVKIVAADLNISESSFLPNIPLPSRDGSEHSFGRQNRSFIDFCGVSPMQNISVATSLIPFLEHDDATRALMGSNMQRQAVPLLKAQGPLVRTGLEGKVVGESGHALQALQSGIVSTATRSYISIDTFCSELSSIPNTFARLSSKAVLGFWSVPLSTKVLEPVALDSFLSSKTLKLNILLKKTLLPNLPSDFYSKGGGTKKLAQKGQSPCSAVWAYGPCTFGALLAPEALDREVHNLVEGGARKCVDLRSKAYKHGFAFNAFGFAPIAPLMYGLRPEIYAPSCTLWTLLWTLSRSKTEGARSKAEGFGPIGPQLGGGPEAQMQAQGHLQAQAHMLWTSRSKAGDASAPDYGSGQGPKSGALDLAPSVLDLDKVHHKVYKMQAVQGILPKSVNPLLFGQNSQYIIHTGSESLNSLQLKKNYNATKQGYEHKNIFKNSNQNIKNIAQLKQIWRKNSKINRERTIQTLQGYTRSNQATICVQRPAVTEGHWVQRGDLVGDCSASQNGILALGQNIVVAYLPMEGFNFEDAIVVSDRLVHEELYTSIHVQRVEFDLDAVVKQHIPPKIKLKKQKSAYKTTQQDWITLQNPHLLKSEKQALNSLGIIKVGSWVGPGDVLVSKVFPVERKIAPSRHLLLAVFQEKKTKTLDTDDTSLRVPKGIHGRVINVKIVGNGIIIPTKPNDKKFGKLLTNKIQTQNIAIIAGLALDQSEERKPPVNFAPARVFSLAKALRSYALPTVFGVNSLKKKFIDKASSRKVSLGSNLQLFDTEPTLGVANNLKQSPKHLQAINAKGIPFNTDKFTTIQAVNPPNIKLFANFKVGGPKGITPVHKARVLPFVPSLHASLEYKGLLSRSTDHKSKGQKSSHKGLWAYGLAPLCTSGFDRQVHAFGRYGPYGPKPSVQAHYQRCKKGQRPRPSAPFGATPLVQAQEHIVNKQLSGPKPSNHKTWAKAWVKTRTSLSPTPSQVFDTWPGSWLFGNPQEGLGQYRFLRRPSCTCGYGPYQGPKPSYGPIKPPALDLAPSVLDLDKVLPPRGHNKVHKVQGGFGPIGPKLGALQDLTVQDQKFNKSLRFGKFEKQQGISFTTNQEVLNNIKIKKLEKSKKTQEYKIVQIRVYIAERKKLQVGDKMSGRHGNKGIVSTILPREDMPYLPDGTCVDMVLNPLGIPSRMNVGQVFECLLGLAASVCGEIIGHTPFDEMYGPEASRSLVYLFLYVARLKSRKDWLFQPNFPGKTVLFDGRTGTPFEQWVTVGRAYMLKLIHMVDEKIHARSIGPRSLVTQQPVKGRARGGGQRLGEMELWALEGFGAAYTLQEMLTVKSDDVTGRENVENSIIFAKATRAHIPETFRMMLFELRCLCLNVELNQNC